MSPDQPFVLVLAIVTGVLALARAVRLVVDDTYPPMEKGREFLLRHLPTSWHELVECPFCVAPYLALPAVGWFATLIAWPHATANLWVWWLVNSWAAVSYVAAMITTRDIPPESRD